jgi:uncharacterized protein YkwD
MAFALRSQGVKTRLLIGACLAVAFMTIAPTAAFAIVADGPTVRPQATTVALTSQEKLLVQLINKERTKRGLAVVKVQFNLTKAARAHSAEMALRQYFAHKSASGESFSARLIRLGYRRIGFSYWLAGENIYYGNGLLGTPAAAVRGWMNSAGHRAVLLNKSVRDIGVGIKLCASYNGAANAKFYTMDVGRRIH